MLKPTFTIHQPQVPQYVDLAYKHPHLLMDDDSPTELTPAEESMFNETNREIEVKFVEDSNSIDLMTIGYGTRTNSRNDDDRTGFKVETKHKTARNAFTSISSDALRRSADDDCKLIGKVNPVLIKTWERLNGITSVGDSQGTDNSTAPASYLISKQMSDSSSDHFYDSIDNESLMTQPDDDDAIASICELDDIAAGGEAMADIYAVRKLCWSIDSAIN